MSPQRLRWIALALVAIAIATAGYVLLTPRPRVVRDPSAPFDLEIGERDRARLDEILERRVPPPPQEERP